MALPSPTPLTATLPYVKFSLTQYLYVPTMANPATPTLAEFNAGKNLTPEIMTVNGFDVQQAEVATPRAGTNFTGSLPGRITPNASSLEFYLSTAGPAVDVRSVFTTLAQAGYIVICNEGIVTGGACDIFPIRVGSISVPQGLEVAATAVIGFSIYKTPYSSIAIPTA